MVSNIFNTESMAMSTLGVIVGATAIGLTGGTLGLVVAGAAAAGAAGGVAGVLLHQTPEQQQAKYDAHVAHMAEVNKREVADNVVTGPSYDARTWTGDMPKMPEFKKVKEVAGKANKLVQKLK